MSPGSLLANARILRPPTTRDELVTMLRDHNLPVAEFGVGGKKSIDSIWAKVANQETDFGEYQGRLVRILPAVARACVTYCDTHAMKYVLVESGQGIYANDSLTLPERIRLGDFGLKALVDRRSHWAVWETMRKGEDPTLAMVRGIYEELVRKDPHDQSQIDAHELEIFRRVGIYDRGSFESRVKELVYHRKSQEEYEAPKEYPELGTLFTAHTFEFVLPDFLFRPAYACRDEEGKLNIFSWMPQDVARDVLDQAIRQQL